MGNRKYMDLKKFKFTKKALIISLYACVFVILAISYGVTALLIDEAPSEDVQPPAETVKNGLIWDDDGELRFYENGDAIYAGLMQDENGDYYYINSSLKAVRAVRYTISKSNGLLEKSTYYFGEDGKLIFEKDMDGFYIDGGSRIYYVDGVLQKGALEIDGDIYFASVTSGKFKTGGNYIFAYEADGLIKADGYYNFDENGKLLNPPTDSDLKKTGLFRDFDGELRYYRNGISQYCGLIRDESGNYYYINSSHKAVRNCSYHVSKTNDLLPSAEYRFDELGRIIDPPKIDPIVPDEPDIPENPDTPATPVVPDEPNNPDTPTTPEVPDTPSVPDTPATPDVPDIPDTPTVPEEPDESDEPAPPPKLIVPTFKEPVYVVYREVGSALSGFPFVSIKEAVEPYLKLGRLDVNVPVKISYNVTSLPKNVSILSALVEISETEDFAIKSTYGLKYNERTANAYFLKTGMKYYFKVYVTLSDGSVLLDGGEFTTARSPRLILIRNAINMRDIGGYETTDGKRIKQGLLYRGSELDGKVEEAFKLTEEGKQQMISGLGIKTDMDLRDPNYVVPDSTGPLGKNIPRKFYNMVYYNQIFTEDGKEKVYNVFYDLALKKNYPVYLHCTYGVDRTGTICFLLEALLGVPEETLLFDYGLTYLYFLHVTSDNLKPFLEEFKATVEGDTLKEKAENYLLSIGITPLQIDSIREIFLEDIPKE